jgi:hypothetical protein
VCHSVQCRPGCRSNCCYTYETIEKSLTAIVTAYIQLTAACCVICWEFKPSVPW